MTSLLSVENCTLRFGGLTAVNNLNLNLAKGELMAVIGPNGAGKTTFFNMLTGVYEPTEGRLLFSTQSLVGLSPDKINRLGIARTFQNIRLFSNLTVRDNVRVAFYTHNKTSLMDAAFGKRSVALIEEEIEQKTTALLELFHLSAKKDECSVDLPYGDQRRLEIVRALVTEPQLLLLDEPAAGMNSAEKKELVELIKRIHVERNLAIILIEHDMQVVMTIAPRILVLDYGVKIAEGTPEEIRKNPEVIKAYLGDVTT